MVLLCVILFYSSRAGGEESCTVVMLVPEDREETARSAVLAVKGQLSDLPVKFHVEWVDSTITDISLMAEAAARIAMSKNAAAVFWLDISVSGKLFFFIPGEEKGKLLTRSVKIEGMGMSGEEAMAVIIRSMIKALPCKPGSEPAPSPPARGKRDNQVALLDFSISYGLSLYSRQKLLIHGARLCASVRLLPFLRIFIAYRVIPPMRIQSDRAVLSLRPHPVEAGLTLRWSRKHWKLEVGAAAVFDWLTWSVTAMRDSVSPTPPYAGLTGAVSPFIAVSWMPARFLAFFLSISADIMVNEKRYVVKTTSGLRTVLDPWKVRPYIQAGTCFSFF